MPHPNELLFTNVVGTILRSDFSGTPASGKVTFKLNYVLRDSLGNVVTLPYAWTATLNGAGAFSIQIPACDSPNINPQNFKYEIIMALDTHTETFHARVPYNNGTTNFADLVQDQTPPAGQTWALASHSHGQNFPVVDLGITGRLTIAPDNLIDAPTVITDASYGNHFRLTLTAGRNLGDPINMTDGQNLRWELIQGGSGGNDIIDFGSKFAFSDTLPRAAITLSTEVGKRDFLGGVYNSLTDKLYVVAFTKGY